MFSSLAPRSHPRPTQTSSPKAIGTSFQLGLPTLPGQGGNWIITISGKEHQDQGSGSPELDPTTTEQISDGPPVEDQPPAKEQKAKSSGACTLCDLAEFIEAHSKYRFKPGGQHDRLLRIVQHRGRQHPAPNDLYLDETQGEMFKAWVLTKIEGVEGEAGRRKRLKSLVSAICNIGSHDLAGLPSGKRGWKEDKKRKVNTKENREATLAGQRLLEAARRDKRVVPSNGTGRR